MSGDGSSYHTRSARRELRQARLRKLSYVVLAELAVATVLVVALALSR